MDIKKLGEFKINGAIDTQFQTTLAVERILIASGHKVNGITSFLRTLEAIGAVLTILLSGFIISALIIIYISLFLVRVFKFFFYKPKKVVDTENTAKNQMSDMIEVSEEDEEKIENFH